MAHAGAQTGVAIPDSGDPHFQADKQAASYLDNLELHQHTGAVGDYQQIPAAGLGIDGPVSWNDNELTDLLFAGFGSQDPAGLPDRAAGVDAAGDLYYKPPGAGAIQITAGGALNTTPGNGITGLAAPAQVTYTPGTGEYRFLQDTAGAGTDGSIRATRVRADGAGSTGYAETRSISTGGALALTEAGASFETRIRMPPGWNVASSANADAYIPPPSVMEDIAAGANLVSPGMEIGMVGAGTWTPTVFAGTKTYTLQEGFWLRLGNIFFVTFRVAYNTGVGVAVVEIAGLPFSDDASIRGVTAPSGQAAGHVLDVVVLPWVRYLGVWNSNRITVFQDNGTGIAGNGTHTFEGALWGFTA